MKGTSSKISGRCVTLAITLALVGCGGKSTPTPTPPEVSVSLNQSSVSLPVGGQVQFTATVQGTSNTAVTWSIDSVTGGNSSVGTIAAPGLYTAPSQAGSHTVMATSVADTTKNATSAITVTSTVSVSPGTASVVAGATQQFTATIQGVSNAAVTWSVDQVSGGNATVGTITATGQYTAPAQVGTHTITATSVATPSTTARAAVSVFTLSVAPSQVTLAEGGTQQFAATVDGLPNAAVTWSVDQISGGSSTTGTINPAGLYAAPAQVGTHTITANVVNSSAAANAAVSVFVFTISPSASTVDPSATEQFQTTIQGLENNTVTWSVDGVAGGSATTGTITSGGLYTAPPTTGAHSIGATSTADPSSSVAASITVVNVAQAAVLTYHNDDARDGAYLEEVSLTPSNVNSTHFGKLFSYPVDGQVYAQPLYLPRVTIGGNTYSVVFVATQSDTVYAFDASGTQTAALWQKSLGSSVPKNDYSGVSPNVGILSTPVIDSTTNTLYLVAESSTDPLFTLHALDVTSGVEKFGGPATITGTSPGTGLDSSNGIITLSNSCYQRMGLALNPVSNAIYIAFGSCDHGWVLAYDKTKLTQTAIFNDTPDGAGGGLWAGGGAPAIDDTTGDLYLMSGVDELSPGVGDPVTDGYNDSFLRLDPNNLSVLDFFTPDDNSWLAQNDVDLGSGSNILMPDNGSSTPHETIGGGKDGNIFVVNRDKMGGYNPPSTNNVIETVLTGTKQFDNIFSTPVYWNGFVYYNPDSDVLHVFSWSNGLLSTAPISSGATAYQQHGATASLSANGSANGIIWDIDNSNYNNTGAGSGPSVLHAYDATNVANELYNSLQAGSRDTAGQALKFTVPTIAGGKVFVPTSNELDVYGLLP